MCNKAGDKRENDNENRKPVLTMIGKIDLVKADRQPERLKSESCAAAAERLKRLNRQKLVMFCSDFRIIISLET